MKKCSIIFLTVLVFFSIVLFGCETEDKGRYEDRVGYGELALFIADSPGDVSTIEEVNVALSKVEVHSVDNAWQVINTFHEEEDGYKTFDLMKLVFDEELLGQEMIPEGNYTKIRLFLADEDLDDLKSHVKHKDGTIENLYSPGAIQAGLQIDHPFVIEENVITRLLLDFDVLEILNDKGRDGYRLRRTAIQVIDQVLSGDIEGQVLDHNMEVILDYVVMVKALDKEEEIVAETFATTKELDGREAGSFRLRGLPAGLYSVTAYIEDEDGNIKYEAQEKVTEVLVRAEEVTELKKLLLIMIEE